MRKSFATFTVLGTLSVAAILCAGLLSRAAAPAPGPSGYHVVKTVPIPGDEGWDYLTVDADARRVYISHGSHVVVMNADTYTVEGDIPDTQGVHGIALAPDLGRGFPTPLSTTASPSASSHSTAAARTPPRSTAPTAL